MVQHDWLIGGMLVSIWSLGPLYHIFSEQLSPPSGASGWAVLASPFLVAGIWKITSRKVFRFSRGERAVTVTGFSLLRGRWKKRYSSSELKLRVEERFVWGKGGGRFWFVRLRGPDFDVALDGLRSQAEADHRLQWYIDHL